MPDNGAAEARRFTREQAVSFSEAERTLNFQCEPNLTPISLSSIHEIGAKYRANYAELQLEVNRMEWWGRGE
ncbi:hypothetical protein HLH34_18755 [Gluconacetobacter azotocaptans]|uniref:Uncharacterized protein n=1 Tax=Gluconacetobacter azotocaptans TaxID=142834 RepID=A0A7W4JW37_9PROT|nr:hypothetical protein [Gluconacetobacter azotocaptans]MBB2191974.1 hypothetical protein [Gluconacetobacter azotocaptans]MBM9401163.1 hypothetical protein [Gluconacetobacter azotocaptans]GBQ31964.1 hypothetical protein AA13594_2237 [Gluconacetobacter azotocaptans DSM 13594]